MWGCFVTMLHFANERLGWRWAVTHWSLSPIVLSYRATLQMQCICQRYRGYPSLRLDPPVTKAWLLCSAEAGSSARAESWNPLQSCQVHQESSRMSSQHPVHFSSPFLPTERNTHSHTIEGSQMLIFSKENLLYARMMCKSALNKLLTCVTFSLSLESIGDGK